MLLEEDDQLQCADGVQDTPGDQGRLGRELFRVFAREELAQNEVMHDLGDVFHGWPRVAPSSWTIWSYYRAGRESSGPCFRQPRSNRRKATFSTPWRPCPLSLKSRASARRIEGSCNVSRRVPAHSAQVTKNS